MPRLHSITAIDCNLRILVSVGEIWSLVRCKSIKQFAFLGCTKSLTLSGLAIASVTIFVRCAFRVAELERGFQSPLASDQVAFMILEGTMVIIACLCLTIGHPGLCLDIAWKRLKVVSDVDLEDVHIRK